MLLQFLQDHRDEFIQLCQHHRVAALYAFGSAITGGFKDSSSDIDLLVEVEISEPISKGQTLLSLWDALEKFFGRKVDLLTENSLKNPYLKASIERTRKLIYDREREKVFG